MSIELYLKTSRCFPSRSPRSGAISEFLKWPRKAFFNRKLHDSLLAIGFALLVTACGSSGVPPYIPTAAPSATTSLTINGTVATGLAIPGATVSGKCQIGTGTTTSNAEGTYSLTLPGGKLPCVLQTTNPADGSKLHAAVTGSGDSAIANITSLTQMLTARVLHLEPATFFSAFDAAVASRSITAAAIAAAQADITAVLVGLVDTSTLADFVGTALKAATRDSLNSGDAQDQMLDKLGARLNGSSLAQTVTALANTASVAEITQTVASLAAPLANAGAAQSVLVGALVTLDGSGSSAMAGRTLTYAWTLTAKPDGSAAALAAATSKITTFKADLAGTYAASLVVNDGKSSSSASTVTITAGATTGSVLSASYTDNGDGTVTDKASALVWMRCSPGQTWTGSVCDGVPGTYVWDDANLLTGAVDFAGKTDWRLPNMRELQTIADRSKFNPAIDSMAFPATSAATYWSSSAYPNVSTAAWYVNFGGGDVHGADKSSALPVRLVRGGATPGLFDAGRPASDFVDNGDGTISHVSTGLVWKRCAEGQSWDGSTCVDTASMVKWDSAVLLNNSTFAGNNTWRLPTAQEIEALVGYSAADFAAAFPNSPLALYWSATPYAGDASSAWGLGFGDGECYNVPKTDIYSVRLVRTK